MPNQVGDGQEIKQIDSISTDVRERVRCLFEFLKRFEERRSPVRRDIEDAEWKLSFSDLPKHPGIKTARGASGDPDSIDSATMLSVARPSLNDCPLPPPDLNDWLMDGWRDPANRPEIREHRTLTDGKTETFDENALRVKAASEWQTRRSSWATAELPARKTMALFERLLALWARLQRDGESVRLLLGDGHLLWKREDGKGLVRHPLLLQQVELRFEENRRELAFVQNESAAFFYADLLSTFEDLDVEKVKLCKSIVDNAVEAGSFSLIGGGEVDEILRAVAVPLSASEAILTENDDQEPSLTPRLQRNPVLFLVPRASGFRGAYEAFLDRLDTLTSLPIGISLAVGGTKIPNQADDPRPIDSCPVTDPDVDLFFTKPANEAQERIARRLETTGAVLVQGPPGTGKTHTIGNLIGHLLAKGKSVLVTAQTSKALRVVREKVVDELKPLCVSVLDSDIESRAELEHAVNGIVSRLTSDSQVFERRASALVLERKELRRQIRDKQKDLRTALHSESQEIVVGGRSVSPSDAGRCIAEGVGRDDWLPGPVEPGAPVPLSEAELIELYQLNAELRAADEDQVRAGLPPINKLMQANDFIFTANTLKSPLPQTEANAAPWQLVSEQSADSLERLAQRIRQAVTLIEKEQQSFWVVAHAGLLGGPYQVPWDDVVQLLETAGAEIASLSRELIDFDVDVDVSLDIEESLKVSEEMVTHVAMGGGLGWFSRIGKGSWTKLHKGSTVNGQPLASARQVQAVRNRLRVEFLRGQVRRWWRSLLEPAGFPLEKTHLDRPEIAGQARLSDIRRAIRWAREDWPACVSEMKDAEIPWDQLLQATSAESPQVELSRILNCVRRTILPAIELELEKQKRSKLRGALEETKETLSAGGRTQVAAQALCAIDNLDSAGYVQALQEIARLRALHDRVIKRAAHIAKLEKVAPGWADVIRARRVPHSGPNSPVPVQMAWEFRQFAQELDRRKELDPDNVQRELFALEEQLQRATRGAVENLAWSGQAARTNPDEHRALMSWLGLVRRIGKGSTKRADQFRRSAREQLKIARSAVPVWIMPLSRVAESFLPGEKLFDVVILDEASQCGLSALVAFALGRRVVVVGDDEQVSPLDIGQKVEQVRALQEEWLDDFSDKELFDGRASAYEIGRRSFPGGLIRLVEHFRCVPDIIAFSNSLSYKDEIKPLRESSAAKVFPAVISHRVPNGKRLPNTKINPAEALEIASLVAGITELDEYAGLEVGIISLLGDEQAREIDTLLQRFIDPTIYKKRRIICGTAAHFQGDERDIVLLSMVDSGTEGPLNLLDRDEIKKRYNVATSRAKDQLWVINSLDPEKDLKKDDLRRRLLLHALQPTAWRSRLEQEGKVESDFERQVLRALLAKGFRVRPQVEVGAYRLDLVVEGRSRRIAIECDGDRFHSLENLDKDLARQAVLERLGWQFIRIRGSVFFRDPAQEMQHVFRRLDDLDIERLGNDTSTHDSPTDGGIREGVLCRAAEIRRAWVEESGSMEDLFCRALSGGRDRWRSRGVMTECPSSGQAPINDLQVSVSGEGLEVNSTQHATSVTPPSTGARIRAVKHPTASISVSPRVVVAMRSETADKLPSLTSDPFCDLISKLLPAPTFMCQHCGAKRKLWIGRQSPFLKCEASRCAEIEVLPLHILRNALVKLSMICVCGAALRVVRISTGNPFVGCSAYPGCRKTYPWPEVRERARYSPTLRALGS